MGRLARFFGLESNEENQENKNITDRAVFVSDIEAMDYSQSIMGKLLSQELDLQFIAQYLPENGHNLIEQADAIKKLLMVSNNEQDPEIIKAFEEYMAMFKKDYKRAEGLSTIKQLQDINKDLDNMFVQSVEKSALSKEKLFNYIDAIKAIQAKVDEREKSGDSIIEGPSRQLFNDKSLESEYRLKMLEVLYLISTDEWAAMHEDTISNPFKRMTSAQKVKFPILFKKDLDRVAQDYGLLAYSEGVINEFGRHKFGDIDKYADELDVKIGTEVLRDFTFKKMFSNDTSPDELFANIKKLVYMRYKLNEMQQEFPQCMERKEEREQEIQKKKEQEERKKQEEIEKKKQEELAKKQKQEKEEKRKAQEAEERRIAKEKAEEEAKKLVDATDEEIQAKIDALNLDVTQTGSRFINIIDFQKMVAKAKGLLPADDMIQDEKLVYKVFSAQGIIKFIKHANDAGVNYVVFPDSQEGADGGFNVVVSNSDSKVLDVPETEIIFGSSKRKYIDGRSSQKWKKHGTAPGYFIAKLQDLYEESDNDNKEEYKEYTYVDKKGQNDVYEIGTMASYGDIACRAQNYFTGLIERTYEELGKQWKDRKEDKDILSYVSIPATYNIIPLLRTFKEKGLTPYFERVPLTGSRNTNNRDDIHIYFYRKDFDKFWYDVRPSLINVPDDKKIPYKVHYGDDYDFTKENSTGLNLNIINEKKRMAQEDEQK